MSSEDVKDENCRENDESHLESEVEIVETSAEKNGAQGDGGKKGANQHKVFEKGTENNKETKIGAGDSKGKDKNGCESVNTTPNKQELTKPGSKDGGSGGILLKQDPKKRSNKKQPAPERAQQPKPYQTLDPGTKSQSSYLRAVVVFLTLAFACIAAAIYVRPPENDMKSDSDMAKDFENGLKELQSLFTNQTDRFWKILRSRGLAHLRSKAPSKPLVFLLAAPPAAHEWVDCLAIKLAENLDPKHKRTLAIIDGENKKGNDPDETKKTMDDYLKKKFKAGNRVAVIHHLELLPPPSPRLFYSYCDDQNALLKVVAIIFTVHMPVEPSSSLPPKEAEGSVEKYLSGEVWVKDDRNAVAALLTRIADTVVLMKGETSVSLEAHCSRKIKQEA